MQIMREILFRGKRIDSNEWIKGSLWNHLGVPKILSPANVIGYDVDFNTVEQYIGLTDKNGVKIFEGDILRYRNKENVKVIYQASEFVLVFKSQEYPQCGLLTKYDSDNLEVIGNIHDNPELLSY